MQEISVREAADLLKVSEKTIYRWIRQGVIPTFKFQGQYRFDRDELKGWALHKRIGSSAGLAGAEGQEAHLYRAVQRGGIHYKIEGDTPEEVYGRLVAFFPFAPGTSQALRDALRQALVEREALVPTAIGHGIALPHPRHPRDWGLGEPAVGVFFLDRPVDFHAMDGEPVFVLFVILCAEVKGHLKLLSQVSHLVNNEKTRAFLKSQPTRTELMERIRRAFPLEPESGRPGA